MNRSLLVSLLLALPLLAQSPAGVPPVAARKPHSFDFHGHRIDDPYFWLKDKTNPNVIRYIEAENAYRVAVTDHLKSFEESLYKEMLSHVQQTDLDVPVKDNGYWYYSRTEEGKQYPIYCRKQGRLTASEEILLDVNELAKGQRFLSARPVGASDDGKLYAYLTDTTGFREYYLSVKDLATGRLVEDKLAKVAGFEWAGDNRTIFYVTEDAAKRPHKLYRHTLGRPKSEDVLVYEEKDELYRLGVDRTRDKKYLVHSSASSDTSESRILAGDNPTGTFEVFQPRKAGVEYSLDHRDGLFYVRTNAGGRTNFAVDIVPVADRARAASAELLPYKPAVFTERLMLFKDFAVLAEREAGVPQLCIYDFRTKATRRIAFPEPSYDVNLTANPEFDTEEVQYVYTSLVTPPSVYRSNMATRLRTLLKATKVPGGFDKANYTSERVEATAPDGVKVPISLVYRNGLVKDGKAPLFLTGYGSYGSSSDPSFSASRLALLDRGVVFALAHIRGGSELGRPWYLDGKLMKKKNTFTDFIACADYLVKQKYGSRDRLAIQGGSAGGLLIGAVLNLRPDVCKVAHLAVPYVDVINTMLDESLPLTVQEFLEWGNPKEKAAGLYMLEYSPYDNLAKRDYPAILVTTSLNDSQVLFHEPTKYVAKLRSLKTDNNPLLLKCNMDAGHGGASGRYDRLRETAYEYAFLLDQMGVRQ